MTLFRDERGGVSAARVYLSIALVYQAWYLPLAREDPTLGLVLTFFAALNTPLIIWAAGPRIAQYLAPGAGQIVQGVAASAQALAAKVAGRRDPKSGYEETR